MKSDESAAAELTLSNSEIADRLMSLAQLLAAQKENPFKVKAYRRAAKAIRTMSQSLGELVHDDADLTAYPGIGQAISGAIRELVLNGTLRQLETLRSQVSPAVATLSEYPRLDPARVLRIYRKLGISSVAELNAKLATGEIAESFGARMDAHVRQALSESQEMLLYDADNVAASVEEFLLTGCGARRVERTGAARRRVEVVTDISFLVETDRFPDLVARLRQYGGRTQQLGTDENSALFKLPSGTLLRIESAQSESWGLEMIRSTGSYGHLQKLESVCGGLDRLGRAESILADEAGVYKMLGLSFIEPELREGCDEVERAARGDLPALVTAGDIRGELHAHSTSSDGRHSIEQMARAAQNKGYEYTGITDHSQSLKIARGLSEEDLLKQIRYIDRLNTKSSFRILKSAEVDILADGSLDYPDELLKELDYTVCSIHSRFALGKPAQTERILRAMDNRNFTILGHPTGRLLLKRSGYEIDIDRVIAHAGKSGCFFEINSSPDRLDLSAAHARLAAQGGVKVAVTTDAHSVREYDLVRYGIDQARRAGLPKDFILNTRSWADLHRIFKR